MPKLVIFFAPFHSDLQYYLYYKTSYATVANSPKPVIVSIEYDTVSSGGLVNTQTSTVIQVSLPAALAEYVERLAQERNVSVDALMADMLVKLVRWEEEYKAAKEDYFSILAQDIFAGNNSQPLESRDELHER